MYIQLSEKYRMAGRHLYRKQGAAFIHCAIVTPRIRNLEQAVAWFESEYGE
jgi:hypothetical protein